MELWFIYALSSAIFMGFYVFIQKISAEKNHNSANTTFYSMFTSSIVGVIYIIITKEILTSIVFILIVSTINILFYYTAVVTRIDALKLMPATIYLPLYKIISTFILFFITILFFKEEIKLIQFIGIIFATLVPILLIEKKKKKKKKFKIEKGIILLIIGAIGTVGSSSVSKYVASSELNILYYVTITYLVGGFLGVLQYKKTKHISHNNIGSLKWGIISGILMFLAFMSYLNAFKTGNLVIVYSINSLSILIPFILSIIIYKEQLNFRKALAVIFTILTLIILK